MITKTVGKLRNLIKYRKEIVSCIVNAINADNVIVLSMQDKVFHVAGHTESDAMNVYLLGRGIGAAHSKAITEHPNLDSSDFLTQHLSVAIHTIQAESAK